MPASTLAPELRTVRNLIDFFIRTTRRARAFASSIDPVGRGFFDSTEADQVEALLVTYWQTRAAALDLIRDLRHRQPNVEPERSIYFLLGYSTALCLVDAACVLRDETHNRPVVRRKLNQPIPSCGIPGGAYDTIQRSLISARNAWHLYHARAYLEQHHDDLARVAREQQVEDLLATIRRLTPMVDVSAARFARYSLRTRGDQFVRGIGRSLFGRAAYGLQKFASELLADVSVRPAHVPMIPPGIVRQLEAHIRPGDVFVVRKEFALTNYFLPGYWPHAALYLGRPEPLAELGLRDHEAAAPRWPLLKRTAASTGHCVLESMKDGVHLRCWRSPLASDSFVILRSPLEPQTVITALGRVLAHEGKDYDFDFDFSRSDRLVCTEVVYRAFDGIGGVQLPLTTRAGRPTLSGGDLLGMALQDDSAWGLVAAYVPHSSPELVCGGDAAAIVRSVLRQA